MPREKTVVILIVLAICSSMHALSFGELQTRWTCSARQLGMGYQASGGANIWNDNPLSARVNPAKLGYFKGLSYSQYDMNLDQYKCNASAISFGVKGLGVSLPMYNEDNRLGYSQEFEQFVASGYYKTERCEIQHYSLGINLGESGLLDINSDIFDVSFGQSVVHFYKERPYYDDIDSEVKTVKDDKTLIDIGALVRVSPVRNLWDSFDLDMAGGFCYYNILKEKTKVNDTHSEPMLFGILYSFALHFAYPRMDDMPNAIRDFSENFIEFTGTYDYDDLALGETDCNIYNWGTEIGLMDTFFFRTGYNNDVDDNEALETIGYGLKFHYRDWAGFEWNYGEYVDDDHGYNVWDIMLNVNIMKIIEIAK